MWIDFVTNHPILSAMLQFAVLGTLGEIVGATVKSRKFKMFTIGILVGKMVIWAILAVMIKYAFTGFGGFVDALTAHHMLPDWGHPFFISVFMNVLFGPVMILTHRILDNVLEKNPGNWAGIKGALLTLLWFWIPAHTITFMLPTIWRITLAACWSVVLGGIMGFFKRKK